MGKIREFFEAVWYVWRHGSDALFRDPLTGLYNRRFLEEAWRREKELAIRHGWSLTLVFFDLDGLKKVNDARGHTEGDRLLRMFAAAFRASDLAVRWGGDEFVVLLAGTDVKGAERMVARITEALGSEVAFSHGIAVWGGASLEDLVAAASRALHHNREQKAVREATGRVLKHLRR